MKMEALLDDFTKYVNNMSNQDVIDSIADAVKHTENSSMLDSDMNEKVYSNSPVQQMKAIPSTKSYAFSSIAVNVIEQTYRMSGKEEIAA